MIETLVGLADKLPSPEARRSMLVTIMRDTVATIVSPEAGAVVQAPADLLTYLTLCTTDTDKLSILANFRQAVNSFVGIQHVLAFDINNLSSITRYNLQIQALVERYLPRRCQSLCGPMSRWACTERA